MVLFTYRFVIPTTVEESHTEQSQILSSNIQEF